MSTITSRLSVFPGRKTLKTFGWATTQMTEFNIEKVKEYFHKQFDNAGNALLCLHVDILPQCLYYIQAEYVLLEDEPKEKDKPVNDTNRTIDLD